MSLLALLTRAQTTPPTGPTDPTPAPGVIDPATLTDLNVVGSVARYSRGTTTVNGDRTWQAPLTLNAPSQELHLLYSSEMGGGSATIAAAIEHGGNVYPASFAGQARATISGTGTGQWATGIVTLPAPLPKGTEIRVRTFATSGSKLMQGMAGQGGPAQSVAGDLTVAGAAPIPVNKGVVTNRITPVAVLGKTTPGVVSVAGIGDSIMEGGADDNYETQVIYGRPDGGGFFTRAARAAGVPATCYGVWADNFPADPSADRRFGALAEHTHGVCEYGTNSLTGIVVNSGGDWKVLGRDAVNFWTRTASLGVKLAQTTLTPKVTTTDGYTTVDGMSPSGTQTEKVRKAFNDWIKDRAPIAGGAPVDPGTPGALRAGDAGHPLVAVIDTNAAVAKINSRGEEVFDVDPGGVKLTADEAHPSPAGHARMAVPVRQWIESLSA